MIYFDHAATSPLRSEVYETYVKHLKTQFANSESSYDLGQAVSTHLEKSRALTAGLLGVKAEDIIFTSGASESNSMAIKSLAWANKNKGKHIITTNIEHASILNATHQLETVFDFDITYLPVNKDGMISLQQVQEAITKETILVSIQAVNNEVGSIQPIQEIGEFLFKEKILFHVDAVQALSKFPLDLKLVDAASFSAHKIGGLKGSGILMLKSHHDIVPLINGGSQEFSKRGGTSNALVHTLFYKTLKLALADKSETVKEINRYLRQELKQIENVVIHSPKQGSPYILSFSVCGFTSEMLANALNQRQIYVSYRSTCHNRDAQGSPVLRNMGKSEAEMESVLRLSFDETNTLKEAEIFIQTLKGVINQYGSR